MSVIGLILKILLFTSLLNLSGASPFTICSNTHFLKTDRFTVDTSQSFGNASYPNWSSLIYTFSFSNSFPKPTSTSAVIAADSFDILLSGGRVQFACKITNNTATSLMVSLDSTLTSAIKVLGFRYLILTDAYSSANSNVALETYFFNVGLNISTTRSAVGTKTYTDPLVAVSGSIVFIPFITGINAQVTSSSNVIDI